VRVGLVLGAGGTVGMAFHVGVLRALDDAGIDPSSAEIVVGTSAGSVVGAYLRSGFTTADLWAQAEGRAHADPAERRVRMFQPAWRSSGDLASRAFGTAVVTGRAALRVPAFGIGPALTRALPAGFYSSRPAIERFRADLGAAWPSKPLWIVAVDAGRGRRVAFGRAGEPAADPGTAVAASCAIPGVYEPVRHDGMVLVDGGVWSTTNLDLVAREALDLVICSAPMAFEPSSAMPLARRVERAWPTRTLATEARRVRAAGTQVLLVRPTAEQLALHGRGRSLLRPDAGEAIARLAWTSTAQLLADRLPTGMARATGG
jgi:NTE family protein